MSALRERSDGAGAQIVKAKPLGVAESYARKNMELCGSQWSDRLPAVAGYDPVRSGGLSDKRNVYRLACL